MNRTRIAIIAWTLLLMAALAIGGLAFYLLRDAERHLAMAGREAERQRARQVAASVDLAVIEAREALQARLAALAAGDLVDALEEWRLDNPLIRNVFVWSPGRGLLFPDPKRPTSDEETAFITRYASLFAGRTAWAPPLEEAAPAVSDQVQARRELAELAKAAPEPDRQAAVTSGWLPWFWQSGLHMLVWAEQPDGRRYGLEMEMAALLSRLVTILPEPAAAGETWAILDDRGEVIHQRGPADLTAAPRPSLSVPIGASLPHWQVALYLDAAAQPVGESFLLLGSLLTAILVAAILLGGSLLLWQARRSQFEARRKTSFVANVSHELKTPLTTIRMYAEMLEEAGETGADKKRRYLGVISSEAQRLTRLVNNLLDFSRMERQRIDLKELVETTLATQAPRLRDTGLALRLQLPEAPVWLETDGDAVGQALLNLVDNAIKYAAEGKLLTVDLTVDAGQVELRIADAGPGIPAGHASRVFDIFHRVDSSLTTRQQGCGLGLSIARQLVRDLGGELTYQTGEVGGACFTIVLPRDT